MQVRFKEWDCDVIVTKYTSNNALALRLVDINDGSPIAMATVNIDHPMQNKGYVCIKDYSENEGMLDALVDANVIHSTVSFIPQGFVDIPIAYLTDEFIQFISDKFPDMCDDLIAYIETTNKEKFLRSGKMKEVYNV